MKQEIHVCDVCGKVPHQIFRQWEEGKIFCSVFCWKEWWGRDWNNWLEKRLSKDPPNVTRIGTKKMKRVG